MFRPKNLLVAKSFGGFYSRIGGHLASLGFPNWRIKAGQQSSWMILRKRLSCNTVTEKERE